MHEKCIPLKPFIHSFSRYVHLFRIFLAFPFVADIVISDKMKTQTSNRTLPLIPEIVRMLKERQARIAKDRDYYGRHYNTEYEGFVCVNTTGDITLPNNLTRVFRVLLKKNNLKHIRLHDLRHSCASLMISNGVQLKQVQEWLGHSNFQTTADVYSHLDFTSKQESAKTISEVLSFSETPKEDAEMSTEEIEQEIARLQKMLAKKK